MGRALATLAAIVAATPLVTAAAPPPLTADGWGDLRIGMSERQLVKHFHVKIPADDGVNSPECREFKLPAAGPDVIVMTENGRVTRVSAFGKSRLSTAEGLRVGSTKRKVQQVFGSRLKIQPNYYDDAEEYLTVWSAGRTTRGVRFETDPRGVVSVIHVGDHAIEYVEGCP